MFEDQKFIVKTLFGLENALADELRALGATDVETITRGCECTGDDRLMAKINYCSRLAMRVLVPFHEFRARHEKAFYDGVRQVNWQFHMDVRQTLAVDAVGRSEYFSHTLYLAQLCKDAIVDQFRERLDRRPNVDPRSPDLRVHVHFLDDKFTLCLNSSGDSLHRRGWRKETGEAPISEVLAAGMLHLSGWSPEMPLVDPMSGSGTILIEAAMKATNTPAQMHREQGFGFLRWKKFDKTIFDEVKKEADAGIRETDARLFGYDVDPSARNMARLNLLAAGMEKSVVFDRKDFQKLEPPTDEKGLLIANPPYDERLELEDAAKFYAMIGERLKHHWMGWEAWLISSDRAALQAVGLRPSSKTTLFNGKLECSFQRFELFDGKRRKLENLGDEAENLSENAEKGQILEENESSASDDDAPVLEKKAVERKVFSFKKPAERAASEEAEKGERKVFVVKKKAE